MNKPMTIADLRHPFYEANVDDWLLWRRTYEGGVDFINNYLQKLSSRETQADFDLRKKITYCPAFAKEAVVEIKNSIYQRFNDITRIGGSETYLEAMKGDLRGVDLIGSSMNSFIGQGVLPELLSMREVGVYVDMPSFSGKTLRDTGKGKMRPYLYIYPVEEICCWAHDNSDDPNEYTQILLREEYNIYDDEFGMPIAAGHRYRYMYKSDEGIHCCFYNMEGEQTDETLLNLSMIPFVRFRLDHSLLDEVSRYQIALLNLASADMAYAIKSNYPFYVEQFDPRTESPHIKPITAEGTAATNTGQDKEIRVGVTQGRRYPINTNPPAFINPSSEPLKISMEKQEQLKSEIRQLVQLAVSSLNPNKQASAESKSLDNQGLEAGLSYIGLELERGERRIAQFWAMYERNKEVATVNYPIRYSLKSDTQRNEDAKSITGLMTKITSKTAQKEMAKEAARILLGSKVTVDTLRKIEQEIDSSDSLTSDFEQIAKDVEMGLVDRETASMARGYPKGVVDKAKKEHADRLAAIKASQTGEDDAVSGQRPGARGVEDEDSNPATSGREEKTESRKTDQDGSPTDKTRGKGESKKGVVE